MLAGAGVVATAALSTDSPESCSHRADPRRRPDRRFARVAPGWSPRRALPRALRALRLPDCVAPQIRGRRRYVWSTARDSGRLPTPGPAHLAPRAIPKPARPRTERARRGRRAPGQGIALVQPAREQMKSRGRLLAASRDRGERPTCRAHARGAADAAGEARSSAPSIAMLPSVAADPVMAAHVNRAAYSRRGLGGDHMARPGRARVILFPAPRGGVAREPDGGPSDGLEQPRIPVRRRRGDAREAILLGEHAPILSYVGLGTIFLHERLCACRPPSHYYWRSLPFPARP